MEEEEKLVRFLRKCSRDETLISNSTSCDKKESSFVLWGKLIIATRLNKEVTKWTYREFFQCGVPPTLYEYKDTAQLSFFSTFW